MMIISDDKNEIDEENTQMGLPIHSQVMKIKQEFEKVKRQSLLEPEMRRVLCGVNRQRRSRSPLGLASQRSISVGVNRNNCCV